MRKLKAKLTSKKGVTMAEMLLCVTLFTLVFFVGLAGIYFSNNAKNAVVNESNSKMIAETILNRIEYEVKNNDCDIEVIDGYVCVFYTNESLYKFDKAVYDQFRVQNLNFYNSVYENRNVLKIDLSLTKDGKLYKYSRNIIGNYCK